MSNNINKDKKYEEIPWDNKDEEIMSNPKYDVDENEIDDIINDLFKTNEHVGDGYNHPGDGAYDSSIPSRVAARKHPKKYKKQILKLKDLMGRTRYGK